MANSSVRLDLCDLVVWFDLVRLKNRPNKFRTPLREISLPLPFQLESCRTLEPCANQTIRSLFEFELTFTPVEPNSNKHTLPYDKTQFGLKVDRMVMRIPNSNRPRVKVNLNSKSDRIVWFAHGSDTQWLEYLKIQLKRSRVLKKILKRRLGANFRT